MDGSSNSFWELIVGFVWSKYCIVGFVEVLFCFCCRERLVVACSVFVMKFDFYFFGLDFDDLKIFALVFGDEFCEKVLAR